MMNNRMQGISNARQLGNVMPKLAMALALVVGLCFYPTAREAQANAVQGAIYGTITDAATGETLIGASVRIAGTAIGSATDLSGNYRIQRVSVGQHELLVSYIGYREQRIPVTVASGQDVRVDVALELHVIEGGEVVITAQAEGQVAAINQQRASDQIVNVVSSARIQELPDANAAESVGRLPGISIQRDAGEGQKVVIRGLSPRYNSVTVNGVALPSTDFEDRSTDLNMVSSEMLAGVEVYKSLTPDQDADAIGGSVNFRLQGAPSGLRANALLQGGYNGLSQQVRSYKGNLSVSNRFFDDRLGVFVQGNIEQADRSSERLNVSYENRERGGGDTTRVLFTNSLQLRDRVELRDRYGASVMFDYQLPNGIIQFTNFVNRLDRNYVSRDNNLSTGNVSANYELREADITTNVWTSALSGDFNFGNWGQFDFTLSRSSSILDKPYDSRSRFTQNTAFDTQNLRRDLGPEVIPGFVQSDINRTFYDRLDFYYQEMRERDLTAMANLQVPYRFGDAVSGFVKFGGKISSKDRFNDNTTYWLRLHYSGTDGGLDELETAFPDAARSAGGQIGLDYFLDQEHTGRGILNGGYEMFFVPDRDLSRAVQDSLLYAMREGVWGNFQDYDVTETVSAGYVMTQINIGPSVMILPGVRYEHTYSSYNAYFGRAPSETTHEEEETFVLRDTTSVQNYWDLFPMVQARIRPAEWFDIRLAYTKTQSRPNLRQTSPQFRIQDNASLINKGTPELRPAISHNVDATLSFYSNRVGLFSVGGYYKHIDGLIYTANTRLHNQEEAEAAGYPAFTGFRVNEPRNLEHATKVRGIEVDWQSNFIWLPSPFNGLVVNANLSRIFSETAFERTSAVTVAEPPYYIPETTFTPYLITSPMLDQPDWIANVSVGYDLGPFSGRVSMLYQEGNLTSFGSNDGAVSYFDTYVRWDAQASYRLSHGISVFAQLNNLTNRADTSLQSTMGYVSQQEFYGRTYNLGLRYRLR